MSQPKTQKHVARKVGLATAALALLGYGVGKGVKDYNNSRNKDKQEQTKSDAEPTYDPQTFAYFKQRMQSLTPAIMVETILSEGTKLDENGLCKPYKDGNGIWTIGFGLTELDGKPVTQNTRHITLQEAWEKSVAFYEKRETFFFMWCYDIGVDGFSIDNVEKASALASIFYNSNTNLVEDPKHTVHQNRNGELRALYKRYGDDVTEDQVRAVFAKYPIKDPRTLGAVLIRGGTTKEWADILGNFAPDSKKNRGLVWRRWLQGQIAMGNITWNDLLDLPVKSMTDFWEYIGGTKEVMFTKDAKGWHVNPKALPQFKEWKKNPVDKDGNKITRPTVRQFIELINPEFIQQIEKAEFKAPKKQTVKKAKKETKKAAEKETTVSYSDARYQKEYDAAVAEFRAGKYQTAIKKYEAMLQHFPNDGLVLNDMAAAYIQLGQYDQAVTCARDVLNKSNDREQYGAAYYNLGVAREKLGEYESALANYQAAQKNGNKSKDVKEAIARVQKIMSKSGKARAYMDAARAVNARAQARKMQNMRTPTKSRTYHG